MKMGIFTRQRHSMLPEPPCRRMAISTEQFFWGALSGWVDNKDNGLATWDYVNTTFIKDIRLGHMQEIQVWQGTDYRDELFYVITGVYNGNVDGYVDFVQLRVLQKKH
ncbi:MAG: hypothetical protein ACL7BU_05995 [Candidatus Phlomobacter fragariae]